MRWAGSGTNAGGVNGTAMRQARRPSRRRASTPPDFPGFPATRCRSVLSLRVALGLRAVPTGHGEFSEMALRFWLRTAWLSVLLSAPIAAFAAGWEGAPRAFV